MRKLPHAIKQPFSHVHKTLVGLGFKAVRLQDRIAYRLTFRTFSGTMAYPVFVPVQTKENGQTEVHLARAYFENEQDTPDFVRTAANCKLIEAADYLEQYTKDVPSLENSHNSMAPNECEIAKLGKQMKHMKTNSELMENGMIPDPVQ